MRKENNLTYLLFAIGCLLALILVCKITPTASQQEEIDFQIRMDDSSQLMHSEIQVQELSESEMWYRMDEPHYDPLKLIEKGKLIEPRCLNED